jgi:hypothetical protein
MKVYTFLTESHKPLLNFFINSFPFNDGMKLEIVYFPQECLTAEYEKEGWNKTMYRKVSYILDSLESTAMNDFFIHSDIDIQFFGDLKSDIESIISENNNVDIFFQNDGNNYLCMGFFVCKKNDKTVNLFKQVLNNLSQYKNDQDAMNNIIKSVDITYQVLPERYFTTGIVNRFFTGFETEFYIPKKLIMHHANYTVGVPNKIKLLSIIKESYSNADISK